jgi:hypothetical protein
MQVEELRADLVDVKHMYREQIDMLVGQVVRLIWVTVADNLMMPFIRAVAFIISSENLGIDVILGFQRDCLFTSAFISGSYCECKLLCKCLSWLADVPENVNLLLSTSKLVVTCRLKRWVQLWDASDFIDSCAYLQILTNDARWSLTASLVNRH